MKFRLPTWQTTLACCLLLAYFSLAVSATLNKCTTYDEIAHLTAGYSYWLFNDYRLQPENGNLPQRWGALPLLVSRPEFPERGVDWDKADVWKVGRQFFYRSGNDVDAMLLAGRVMIALLGVALGWLVFCYARRLFGPAAGLVSLTLYVCCPNVLAHGALITSDMAASLFFLASLAAIWRLLQEISWRSTFVCGLVLSGLFLAKYSAPIIVPVMVLLAVVRVVDGRPLPVRWRGERTFTLRRHQAEIIFCTFLVQMLLVAAVIWTCYGFRFSAFAEEDGRFFKDWGEVLDGFHVAADACDAILWMRDCRLLPEAYLYGFSYTLWSAYARNAFLNGELGSSGWRVFFPYAFAVKTPLSVFVVLLLAASTLRVPISRALGEFWRGFYAAPPHRFLVAGRLVQLHLGQLWQGFYATAPLWFFLAIYWYFAINTRLNIGLRHILPTYAPMFILAGAAAGPKRCTGESEGAKPQAAGWVRRVVLAAALGWSAFTALWTWPNYLAYFNEIVGGPRNGYKHLVDSSLDWGQDLPGLRQWLDGADARLGPVQVIYFGTGSPEYYGIDAHRPNRPLTELPDRFDDGFRPGIYCVSATYLQGVYLRFQGVWTPEKDQLLERGKRLVQLYNDGYFPSPPGPWARRCLALALLPEFNTYRSLLLIRLMNLLKERPPDDNINGSILIFRVSSDDLEQVRQQR